MLRIALIPLVVACLAQDKVNEAEKAFAKVAEALEKSKASKTVFAGSWTQGGKKIEYKGTLQLKEGNRARIDCVADGKEGAFVSDGKKARARREGKLSDIIDAHPKVQAELATLQARLVGGLLTTEVLSEVSSGKQLLGEGCALTLSDFALGAKDGENAVVTFKATMTQLGEKPLVVKVWIDAKNRLVRRTAEMREGDKVTFTLDETFSEWTTDATIADDVFKLPEK